MVSSFRLASTIIAAAYPLHFLPACHFGTADIRHDNCYDAPVTEITKVARYHLKVCYMSTVLICYGVDSAKTSWLMAKFREIAGK